MMLASSLQKAAAIKKADTPSSNSGSSTSNRQESGAFEACFARGVDLSEFERTTSTSIASSSSGTSTCSGNTTTKSHAAALLRVLQVESAQKQHNVQEEMRLWQTVQQRRQHQQTINQDPINSMTLTAPAPWNTEMCNQTNDSHFVISPKAKSSTSLGALVINMHNAEQRDKPKQKLIRHRNKVGGGGAATTVATIKMRTMEKGSVVRKMKKCKHGRRP